MPRPKTLPDEEVLEAALRADARARPGGADLRQPGRGLRACRAATLVQRFKSKAGLKQSTLLYAWDGLDEKTAALAATVPKTPDGAIELLVGALERLWRDRSLCRGPAGAARGSARSGAAGARRGVEGGAVAARSTIASRQVPHAPPGIGLLMASQWQGSLLWWGFDPQGRVESFVEKGLRAFVAAVVPAGAAGA